LRSCIYPPPPFGILRLLALCIASPLRAPPGIGNPELDFGLRASAAAQLATLLGLTPPCSIPALAIPAWRVVAVCSVRGGVPWGNILGLTLDSLLGNPELDYRLRASAAAQLATLLMEPRLLARAFHPSLLEKTVQTAAAVLAFVVEAPTQQVLVSLY